MNRSRNTKRDIAEKAFRHGVDISVPEGGFGAAINAMYCWPAEAGIVDCAQHGAGDVHRFYASTAETAAAFQAAFGGKQWELPDTLTDRQMLSRRERDKARVYHQGEELIRLEVAMPKDIKKALVKKAIYDT